MKMSAKNTPGPWDLYSAQPVEQYVDHVEDAEEGSFCIFQMQPGKQVPPEEAAANARLVIAACNGATCANPDNPLAAAEALPDLLEAAKRLVAIWDVGLLLTLATSELPGEYGTLKAAVKKAKAVTAKAKSA